MAVAGPRPRTDDTDTYLIFAAEFRELQRIARIDDLMRVYEMLRQVEHIVGPTGRRLIVAHAGGHSDPFARAIEQVNEQFVWDRIAEHTQNLVRDVAMPMDAPGDGAVYRPPVADRDDASGLWTTLDPYDTTRDRMDGPDGTVYPPPFQGRASKELSEARLIDPERERKHWIEHIKQASKESDALAHETEQAQITQAVQQQRPLERGHRQEQQDTNPSQPKQPTQPQQMREREGPRVPTRGR